MGLKWLEKKETTRSRSGKQETKIAKDLKGHTTVNSGATFGQNDVTTDYCEIEAKTTKHSSYTLKVYDFEIAEKKTKIGKLPIFVIDFEKDKKSLAVLNYQDLLYLIKKANE